MIETITEVMDKQPMLRTFANSLLMINGLGTAYFGQEYLNNKFYLSAIACFLISIGCIVGIFYLN